LDTKWKSIKRIFSFLVFFLGVSLTLGNLSSIPALLRGTLWTPEAQTDDYQQSKDFRWYI